MNDKSEIIRKKFENIIPKKIKSSNAVESVNNLLKERRDSVSFHSKNMSFFSKKGAFVLLDFGKELCGGIRLIVRDVCGEARFHIRLGESITEAMADLGSKNAGNNHSPRDFEVTVPMLSDLTFGQSGFRFAYIELISMQPVTVQSILAVNNLPDFTFEAKIETDDQELNKILDTAAYTMKLCCQNGYIWDGIKRDRLVWCGDLHQEILTSFYLFGDIENIRNSISFVQEDTDISQWVNWIPTYSAWWIINLCDYCILSGNKSFFEKNKSFIINILKKIASCIDNNGNMTLEETTMPYFLDWPTINTEDAVLGTMSVFILAAKRFLAFETNEDASDIITKLMPILDCSKPKSKQAIAFKFLANECKDGVSLQLEENGASGFSTFMAYYILLADAMSDGSDMLAIIKQYFGSMLQRGATTFWEDFDINWLNNSGRIDEFPESYLKDIHGDFGKFCYENFRHSLCHGWSSGIVAFFIEYIMGIKIRDNKLIEIKPHLHGIKYINAEIPIGNQIAKIKIVEDNISIEIINSVMFCTN